MIETTEKRIVEILNNTSQYFKFNITIESYNEKQKILDSIKEKDIEIHKAISDYILLLDSYSFIKSDKMLMFKARDIWKMEVDNMKEALVETDTKTLELFNIKGIKKA
jgi:hypothetical protein